MLSANGHAHARAPTKQPRLMLAIVVDQFRYDYLTRVRVDYNAGLARLLDRGAVFTAGNLSLRTPFLRRSGPLCTGSGHCAISPRAPLPPPSSSLQIEARCRD